MRDGYLPIGLYSNIAYLCLLCMSAFHSIIHIVLVFTHSHRLNYKKRSLFLVRALFLILAYLQQQNIVLVGDARGWFRLGLGRAAAERAADLSVVDSWLGWELCAVLYIELLMHARSSSSSSYSKPPTLLIQGCAEMRPPWSGVDRKNIVISILSIDARSTYIGTPRTLLIQGCAEMRPSWSGVDRKNIVISTLSIDARSTYIGTPTLLIQGCAEMRAPWSGVDRKNSHIATLSIDARSIYYLKLIS